MDVTEFARDEKHRREVYAERMMDACHEDVLDALVRAHASNKYGSHAAEIRILRAEALRRMGGN